METFLQLVARDLYQKIGDNLSRTAIVFPNKRAGLFFNEYLAACSSRPIWSPAYLTISELFRQHSPLQNGDPIRLVCELYKIFVDATQSQETLDDFYFWGELLIADFDDIDKNLVPTERLFSNLQELKAMDDFSFLDSEQEAAIRQFFQNFSIEQHTELKQRFISLWDKLGDIYNRYRERLQMLGIAYEGMLYRRVLDEWDMTNDTRYDQYVFVGFNVLNRVENQLFTRLKSAGKALFYWDYDVAYASPDSPHHEAGEFILRNLPLFPNELTAEHFDRLRQPKRVSYIAASTENAQARYLPQWINEVKRLHPDLPEKQCAVVLCNESLLQPVLHSIPESVQHVNITMGFPLTQTPAAGFVEALLQLYTEGYDPQKGRYRFEMVLSVLKHPYIRTLSAEAERLERALTQANRFYPLPSELQTDELLTRVFTPISGLANLCQRMTELLKQAAVIYQNEAQESDLFNQLHREALFKSYTLVNRLQSLMEGGDLTVRPDTFRRLMSRLMNAASIPFHGEPAIGMQIMGVLETRNLDFNHLLLLSVNEGELPKKGGDASFIPYNLRKAFGMTTIEHKNCVYAYYFYRLIQRAESITLLYSTATDGLNRGEMSRFMLQYLLEGPAHIERHFLQAAQNIQRSRSIRIEKTPQLIEALIAKYDTKSGKGHILAPSALNTYLDCPLKFYFRYVAELSEPDEVTATIDSALFGTLFHRSAELLYLDLTARDSIIRPEDIDRLLHLEPKLQGYVDRAFKELFFHVPQEETPEYNGTQLIHSRVVLFYLKQLLRNDLRYAPFRMKGMEKRVSEDYPISCGDRQLSLRIGGVIDRLDSKEGILRIVDYKTGGMPKSPESIEQLFTPDANRPGYIFQTFLYASILTRQQPMRVAPSLLYIHRAASDTYSPVIEMGAPRQKMPVDNFALYDDEFLRHLHKLLEEIFHPQTPFKQTNDPTLCSHCDFRSLCRR